MDVFKVALQTLQPMKLYCP